MKTEGFENQTDIYQLRYSNCWEDADVVCAALKDVGQDGRLLSIASAGDNTLALLTLDPKEVVAVDVNPVQLACLDLKAQAIRRLSPWNLLEFLGIKDAGNRVETFRSLKAGLRDESSTYWEKNLHLIAQGIVHAGRLEGHYDLWKKVSRFAHSSGTVEKMLDGRSQLAQSEFFHRHWNNWRWRALYRIVFGRKMMGNNGRDAAFYKHARNNVIASPLAGQHRILQTLPAHRNPYFVYQETGNFRTQALPLYLRSESLELIRNRIDRLVIRRGPIEAAAADGPYDGMNLSNIFEYMGQEYFEGIYRSVHQQLRPGGRMVYWNLHVNRKHPESLAKQVLSQDSLCANLMRTEKTGVYSAIRVEDRAVGHDIDSSSAA